MRRLGGEFFLATEGEKGFYLLRVVPATENFRRGWIAGQGLVKSHSLHCNERASSFRAVSTTWRLVCPVLVVIRSRLAAAFGESITCNLDNSVPSGSLSARSLYRFCRSAVLIGPISRPPFRYSVTSEGVTVMGISVPVPQIPRLGPVVHKVRLRWHDCRRIEAIQARRNLFCSTSGCFTFLTTKDLCPQVVNLGIG